MNKLSFIITIVLLYQRSNAVKLLCNSTGTFDDWWCAKDNVDGQQIVTSLKADSCFCVMFQNQTQKKAFDLCSSLGGFLADIQNEAENVLIGRIIATAQLFLQSMMNACGINASYFDGMCYVYHSKLFKSWKDAENYCQRVYGGHLPSIHSTVQQEFLMNNVSRNCSGCSPFGFWVGGNNYGNATNWKWSDGTPVDFVPQVTKHKGWPTQPDDPKNQQCMTLCLPDGGWADWLCSYPSTFACSYSIPLFPSWIGLQKVVSGNIWNLGNQCQTIPAVYQSVNQTLETADKTSYLYSRTGTWANVYMNTTSMSSVCRLDRNMCGRNLCPSCSTCSQIVNSTCYRCT